jgi:hypothetical protein
MSVSSSRLIACPWIAESGSCKSLDEIKKQLKREGYSVDQITGGSLLKQLQELFKSAKSRSDA